MGIYTFLIRHSLRTAQVFGIIRGMNATLEKTVTVDRALAQRAERKLRRYGRTFDDAVEYALLMIVSVRGAPQMAATPALRFTVDGRAMRVRRGVRLVPDVEESEGVFSARLDGIGLDAFSETREGLAAEVGEQLALLWREYALADDSELTESARAVKRNLLASFEEAADA